MRVITPALKYFACKRFKKFLLLTIRRKNKMVDIIDDTMGAVCWGENRFDVFQVARDQRVRYRHWDGTAWGVWHDLGGIKTSGVAVAYWKTNANAAAGWNNCNILVFTKGRDNCMWQRHWDGAKWKEWELLSYTYTFASAPAAIYRGSINKVNLFVKDKDGILRHRSWVHGGPGGVHYYDLGGITSAPAVTSWGNNRLDVFARGADNKLIHKFYNGSNWSGWNDLGGTLKSSPTAVSCQENRIDVFAVGTDNGVWTRTYRNGSWSNWATIGGASTSSPVVCASPNKKLYVICRGEPDELYHKELDCS
jgi:hypothetical protein